jgi:hypothetical protein
MSRKILLDEEIENQICELIKNNTQKEIGIKFGLSQSFINGVLKKRNIKIGGRFRLNRVKLNVNVDFFKEIDTPTKAYWLGYLLADGNINKIETKCNLISKDLEIIQKFKNDIDSEHKISKNEVLDKRNDKKYENFTIQVTNKNFVLNLLKHGLNTNKSDIFKMPNINHILNPYFFAGLFDGDGYVGLIKNNPRISLISTKEVLIFLQNYLLTNFNVTKTKLQKVTNNKDNVWKIHLYKDSIIFLNWIYFDENFNYLKRKYEKYLSFVL